jgi:hypothetical protein
MTRPILRQAIVYFAIICTLVGCTTAPPPAPPKPAPAPPVQPVAKPEPAPVEVQRNDSYASTPHEYRRDGANHIYSKNSNRIFKGKMPPLLHAVAVLQVEINSKGTVTGLQWMRAPSHAPEVVAENERSVRSASPFPAPVNMGRVTYTDTWLWHKSGRFQLDTLTEGQL